MDLRDPVSSASHLFTAVWALFATLILLRLTRPGDGRRTSVLVYGLSMVFLYTASGTFHGLYYDNPADRRFFQLLDQTAIYLLIAGTCTPPLTMLLQGKLRKRVLALTWGMALFAVACLWLLPRLPHAAIVGLCLMFGWLSFFPVVWYYRAVGWRAMNLVWLGAACYSLGGLVELVEWPVIWHPWVGFHEVFHFLDMAGSLVFFLFIIRYVIPYKPETRHQDRSEIYRDSPTNYANSRRDSVTV